MIPGSAQPANPIQQAPPVIPTQQAQPYNPTQQAPPVIPTQPAPAYGPTQPMPPYNPAPAQPYNPAPQVPGMDIQASAAQGETVLSSWQIPVDNPSMNGAPSAQGSDRRRYAWLWFLIPIITILAFVVYLLTKGSGDTTQGQTTAPDSPKTEQPTTKENTETQGGLTSTQETGDETKNNVDDGSEPSGNVVDDPQPQMPPQETAQPAQQSRDQWQMLHQNGDVVRGEELLVGFPNQTEEQIISGLKDMVRDHMISLRQYDEAIEALERGKMQ